MVPPSKDIIIIIVETRQIFIPVMNWEVLPLPLIHEEEMKEAPGER